VNQRSTLRRCVLVVLTVTAACSTSAPPDATALDVHAIDAPGDVSADAPVDTTMDAVDAAPVPRHVGTGVMPRFRTASVMFASIEMQQSGEPLAEAMGRDLAGYDRNALEPDLYQPPGQPTAMRDPAGYSAAVESYEYSKYHMNTVAFESGPATSLAFGPLLNPAGATGTAAHDLLRDIVQSLAIASHAGVRALPSDAGMSLPTGFVTVPAPDPIANPLNTLGFGGLWPMWHPFRSFVPTIRPSNNATRGCSLSGGYGASAGMAVPVGDYECGYSSLHIVARIGLVDRVIEPEATGMTAWKLGLWINNYLQLFHDTDGNAIVSVASADQALVGSEGNRIVGLDDTGAAGAPGTWLGSVDLEGFQAGIMIHSLDNALWHTLSSLTTDDASTLGGFATVADALSYDHGSSLRWIPTQIAVTEESDALARFPRPTGFRVTAGGSQLAGLLALLGGASQLYALTDLNNPDVGGTQTTRAWFDGSPFPQDDGLPNGDATQHDRWLGMIKFALVAIDRIHRSTGDVLVADASIRSGTIERSPRASVRDTALALIALRTARRALTSRLTLYSNGTPDSLVLRTSLDATSWRSPPDGESIAQRLNRLIRAQASHLFDRVTNASGHATGAWDLTAGRALEPDGDLAAHAAAIRGLLEGYLATGETRFRDRARAVFESMDSVFWDAAARSYRTALPNERVWTPETFGWLQGALRELYTQIGARPGGMAFGDLVLERLGRTNKLVLNGWDDRNNDGRVQWPDECVRVESGIPRGGLQLAERALTGELGVERGMATSDRDHDCVPEIDDVFNTATLADQLVLVLR